MVIGAGLLVKTIRAIEAGKYKEIPQNTHQENELKKAPKIFRKIARSTGIARLKRFLI
jgi:methionyl-tRNA formyltransferase